MHIKTNFYELLNNKNDKESIDEKLNQMFITGINDIDSFAKEIKNGKEILNMLENLEVKFNYKNDSSSFESYENNLSKDILECIVREDKKGRYAYNKDHTLIRCVQGHSIKIVGTLVEKEPPAVLYHGTATRFQDSILKAGLLKGNELPVSAFIDRRAGIYPGGSTKLEKRDIAENIPCWGI